MTPLELKSSMEMVATNYSKALDKNIMTLWSELFIKFDAKLFKAACLKAIVSNQFFPNASEIIDAYQYVKHESEHKRYEKLKENQRLLSSNQAHCYLCGNGGWCDYTKSGHRYVTRCICSHGQDLNRFSESQIKQGRVPEIKDYYLERDKSAIKHGNNPFYISTIQEVLGEDFAIYDARQKEKYFSRLSREVYDDTQEAEILEKIKELGSIIGVHHAP